MKINGKPDGGGSAVITGISITSNGTYNPGAGVDGFAPVEVSVPIPTFVTETLSVSQNGEYTPGIGVDGYSYVSVNVPIPSYSIDSLTATSNYTYDPASYNVDYFSTVTVNVQPPLQAKSVSENGTVTPDEGYYGLSAVEVSVPTPSFVTESLSVSENGTYTPSIGVDGFSQVVVDVPQSGTGYTEKDITEKNINIVNLSNSASFVASEAFFYSSMLKTVYLPNCTNIYRIAFSNCSNLESLYIPQCQYIEENAFNNCKKLKELILPNAINVSMNAFLNCTSLSYASLTITGRLGNAVFKSAGLQSVYFVCSWTGFYTFENCRQLSVIYFGSTSITTFGEGAFNGTPIASGTGSIYVPASLLSNYKNDSTWTTYSSQIFPIE